jgi:hypothetical protein
MMRRVGFSLALLVCAAATPSRADEAVQELRVFYTGHSFHMFVPGRIAQYARAADVKEYHQAGAQGIGGSRVQQHWDLSDDKNQAKRALESGKVDVFTMAPNVKMPDEGIDRFAELGLKHNPKMRFLIQESWVPGDYLDKRIANNAARDEADLKKLRADQEKWRGQMEEQAKAINEKAKREAVFIVPAGDAVVKLREMVAAGKVPGITKQSELFTDPIGHVKPPVAALAAYCNYACLTGRSPVGLKVSDPAISDELNELLQKVAWETVTEYPMSGVKAKK